MTQAANQNAQAAPAANRLRCGIDLGTTYSAISWYDEYNKRVITADLVTIADGNRVVRSAVYFPGPGQDPVVGEVAWNAKRQFPERVVHGIKRAMGERDFKVGPIDGKEYTPPEVSAELLKALAKDAGAFLGDAVTDVVITVPAYFEDNERSATLAAGRMAGLNVLGLLSEPQAAALAYCVDKSIDINDKYVLVYDLGGGTFDVTLVYATSKSSAGNNVDLDLRTLYKKGNVRLGGLDWDRALANIVSDKVRAQDATIDVFSDEKNEAYLLDNCEKAKRLLSQSSPATIMADMAQPTPHQAEVSRTEFEDRTADLLLQTQALLEDVFTEAEKGITDSTGQKHQISRDRIDVLLSGGSSKMPMVEEMIQRLIGRPPLKHGNPELLVTMGAAYWAHVMRGGAVEKIQRTDDGMQKVTTKVAGLTDQSAFSVGVEVLRGGQKRNSVVVPRPAETEKVYQKTFSKVEDDMEEIAIILYECDQDQATDDPANCRQLGTFVIDGLPPGGKKGEEVLVKLWFDANVILNGEGIDVKTGRKVDIRIER